MNNDINIDNKKTKLCRFYEKYNDCNNGKNCTYAHGKSELKTYKKSCRYGTECYNKDKFCYFDHSEKSDVNEFDDKSENIKNETFIIDCKEFPLLTNKYKTEKENEEIVKPDTEDNNFPEITLTINGKLISNNDNFDLFTKKDIENPIDIDNSVDKSENIKKKIHSENIEICNENIN